MFSLVYVRVATLLRMHLAQAQRKNHMTEIKGYNTYHKHTDMNHRKNISIWGTHVC